MEVLNNYTIHDNGDVFNNKGRKLKTRVTKLGYVQTWLTSNYKTKFVFIHRLVAYKYLGNPGEGYEINHKDGNKLNNHISNLEWVTRQTNITHAWDSGLYKRNGESPNSKIKNTDIKDIFEMKGNGLSYKQIAKRYNVSPYTIRDIIKGRTWKTFEKIQTT